MPLAFAMRHPWRTVVALFAFTRLPVHVARLTNGTKASVILAELARPSMLRLPLGKAGVAELEVPSDISTYTDGPRKRTLRRRLRSAHRHGITC